MMQEPVQNEPILPEDILPPAESATKKKRTALWVIIGVVAVIVLGGAAFLAGRFF